MKALPVIDEARRLRGIVTRADLALASTARFRWIERIFNGPQKAAPRASPR